MELGGMRRVCKLVGCVVVTEEEQNKLLMGVGLAGGSRRSYIQLTARYSTVVKYPRVHVHNGICASQLRCRAEQSHNGYSKFYFRVVQFLSHVLLHLLLFHCKYFGLFRLFLFGSFFVVLSCPLSPAWWIRHSLPIFLDSFCSSSRLLPPSWTPHRLWELSNGECHGGDLVRGTEGSCGSPYSTSGANTEPTEAQARV